MKKVYKKPNAANEVGQVGFPTVLAIGAASAAFGAASVAVGKMVGSILPTEKANLMRLPYNELVTI